MFSASADLYDVIYSTFKDYAAESFQIAGLLREADPSIRTVLDVACGTGEHARLLTDVHGFRVDGIDLDPGMVRIAQGKNPSGGFVRADMSDFELGRRYDAVLCLFSSIGYARTLDNLGRALSCMRRHLVAGGIAIVEPWFPPEAMRDRHVDARTVDAGSVKVCRMSHVEVQGRISRVRFEYLVGNSDGVRHMSEIHELGLFTVDEMTAAFRGAGFDVEHDPVGFGGRGLYVGRAPG